MEGYEIAARYAFSSRDTPDHFDASPIEAMDFLATAAGFERSGRPVHLDLDRIIDHFGSEDAVVESMKANAEKVRKKREEQP